MGSEKKLWVTLDLVYLGQGHEGPGQEGSGVVKSQASRRGQMGKSGKPSQGGQLGPSTACFCNPSKNPCTKRECHSSAPAKLTR